MKNLLKLSVYFLIGVSTLFISCNKDDESETPTGPVMTANIDGTAWAATQMDCIVIGGKPVITGGKPQDASIVMSLDSFEVGTTQLTQDESNAGALITATVTYITNASPDAGGSVTISTINSSDSIVSGSFDFKVYSPDKKGFVTISNGVFNNIPYTYQ